MQGLKVGHHTQLKAGTGLSVFLFARPAVGAYHLAGASPATFDVSVLDLDANVTHADALLFLGGSAFGLSAVKGVQQWLQENNRGWPVNQMRVPIVPAAAIYDLNYLSATIPSADDAYQACQHAVQNNDETKNVGAGTGATVGKIIPDAQSMKGGIGFASITIANDINVLVYAVVNCVGDVKDATGKIIAGAQSNQQFIDTQKFLLTGHEELKTSTLNTTLIAIFTDAKFSKIELKRIAKMAVAGMSQAIAPVFTRYDGDIIFSFSLGEKSANEIIVGAAAVEATRQSILNAVF